MFFIYLFCFRQVQSEPHLWFHSSYSQSSLVIIPDSSKFEGWDATHLWYGGPLLLLFLDRLALGVLFVFLLEEAAQPRYFWLVLLLVLLFHGSQIQTEPFRRSTAHFKRRRWRWRHRPTHHRSKIFNRVKFLPVTFTHLSRLL